MNTVCLACSAGGRVSVPCEMFVASLVALGVDPRGRVIVYSTYSVAGLLPCLPASTDQVPSYIGVRAEASTARISRHPAHVSSGPFTCTRRMHWGHGSGSCDDFLHVPSFGHTEYMLASWGLCFCLYSCCR